MKILGERLKQLREENGFSQNKLAKLIGVPQSSVNRYETGFTNPTPETLLWYADYFDVSMDFLAVVCGLLRCVHGLHLWTHG